MFRKISTLLLPIFTLRRRSSRIFYSVLLVASMASAAIAADAQVSIKGSDTMAQLASHWAESYMDKYTNTDISVNGGGSGTGIAALIGGTTDIASSSREIKPEEVAQAKAKSIDPVATTVANDGIPVIVNLKNKATEMTMEQVRKIFSGEYTNWNQVGGPDMKITVISRDSSSGTYAFVQEHVLAKKDFVKTALLLPTHAAIIQAVEADETAIGYAGLGHAEQAAGKIRILGIKKDAASAPVIPSIKTVNDKTYPIARPLFLYTNGKPAGQAKAFIDFCLTADGQKIVEEEGLVPLAK